MSASLTWANGNSTGISLQVDRRNGAFVGTFASPAADEFQRALLLVQEGTSIQRIPVDFPPATAMSGRRVERLDFGVDSDIFRAAVDETGGVSLAQRPIPATSSVSLHDVVIFVHFLLSLAFVAIAAGVWSRNLNS